MPVIIKICVFAFVYSASLVETTCGLFPIFRWSGVPTRAARTQYWNWPFFLGRQPANTACNSLVDLLFSIYMEIIKSINGTGRIPETLRSWDFFQSWDWQHSVLRRHFSLLRCCVSVKVHWSIGLGARFTQLLKKWKSVFLGPAHVSLAVHRLQHQRSCNVAWWYNKCIVNMQKWRTQKLQIQGGK